MEILAFDFKASLDKAILGVGYVYENFNTI